MKERITPTRQSFREAYWYPIRIQLRAHIAASSKGAASQIAKHLNVKASQVHRWACPICEHDAEPKYSLACALAAYLSNPEHASARNGRTTHRTIFQAQQAKPRWPVKLMEVVREGSDWSIIPLN